jgi:hypothetical protein
MFSSGSIVLFSPLKITGPSTMSCITPQICLWVADGITGRGNALGAAENFLPDKGTPCIFPFFYAGRFFTSCQSAGSVFDFFRDFGKNFSAKSLENLVNGTGFCSLTKNMTTDLAWAVCSCVGPSNKGGLTANPVPIPGEWNFGVSFNGFFVRKALEQADRYELCSYLLTSIFKIKNKDD